MLFSKTAPRHGAQKEVKCALYDFQYVGSGLGVVDLAYFLGTTVDGRDLRGCEKEEGLLRLYFEEVESVLKERGVGMGGYTWEALAQQWEWAVVDWMRFMAGWGVGEIRDGLRGGPGRFARGGGEKGGCDV